MNRKWVVFKTVHASPAWLAYDPQCRIGGDCRCRYFPEWRDAIRYAVWHATGRTEPTS